MTTMTTVLLLLALQPTPAPAAQEYLVWPQDKLDIVVIPYVFIARGVTV